MSQYAFIFARGGSKGLPGKNIKPLNGKPLIAYSVDLARSLKNIKEVFVSTDDQSIADVALQYGATIIMRPAELATDTSPEWLSWQHAIRWVNENRDPVEIFISLPATSPLRNSMDITSAVEKLITSQADLCLAVTPASRSPYFNMVTSGSDGLLQLAIQSEHQVTRRQDAPAVYDITTVVYAAWSGFILSHSSLFSGKITSIEVPKNRAVDIDDEVDFLLAELLMKKGHVTNEK